MFGNKNGSLSDFSRGRKNACTSSAVAKPFRDKRRAMDSQPQRSLQEIGPPFSSSGGRMIQRACRVDRRFAARSGSESFTWLCRVDPESAAFCESFLFTRLCTDYLICEAFPDNSSGQCA